MSWLTSWLHAQVDQSTGWYGFWSGPAVLIGLLANAYVSWRKHNCHQPWCPLIGRHELEGRHYCRLHHGKK